MVEQVSTGILKPMFAAFENEKPLPEKPILQVMKVGLTNQNTQNSSQQRYRVAFSDGQFGDDYWKVMRKIGSSPIHDFG
ncbi:hypothetical protein Glove_117g546 [Diversispora epigaea]|uniref:Uncharacterized protein n=1 Tax=Diversispora epigaea TaxID=1348612 RepID=A0A397J3Q9_9GLOM|nr:hypothetical protein Glove_117g546 [Diversispora epigaea]